MPPIRGLGALLARFPGSLAVWPPSLLGSPSREWLRKTMGGSLTVT